MGVEKKNNSVTVKEKKTIILRHKIVDTYIMSNSYKELTYNNQIYCCTFKGRSD